MDSRVPAAAKRRGRPSKFGRPSRVVALTLPEDAIDRLRRIHRDLGWAILKLLDKEQPGAERREATQPDVELVTVADRRSLIVVNPEVIKNLPGVSIIPFSGSRAFLALDIDRGMSDLELAVSDRLGVAAIERAERRALVALRAHLTAWRRDQALQVRTRAIIVVERLQNRPSGREGHPREAVAKRAPTRAAVRIGPPSDRPAPHPRGLGSGRPPATGDARPENNRGVSRVKRDDQDLHEG
jgi:hypothetical protein